MPTFTQKIWIYLLRRHAIPSFLPFSTTTRVTTITNFDILLFLFFSIFITYYTSESLSYLRYDYCLERKNNPEKCSPITYRIGKSLQKLGPLLHVSIAMLFLPVTKNSYIHSLLNTSFERCIYWHRTCARWIVLLFL